MYEIGVGKAHYVLCGACASPANKEKCIAPCKILGGTRPDQSSKAKTYVFKHIVSPFYMCAWKERNVCMEWNGTSGLSLST